MVGLIMHVCVLSCLSPEQHFATLWTVAPQAPLSMGFSRQEYWCGLPCPPPGDLPDSGIESRVFSGSCIPGGFSTAEPSGHPLSGNSLALTTVIHCFLLVKDIYFLLIHYPLRHCDRVQRDNQINGNKSF